MYKRQAQYVATALVGGQDTVAHHKHGGTDVIGDDTDGNVRRMVAAVGLTRNAVSYTHLKPAGLPVTDEGGRTADTLINRALLYLYHKGEYAPERG